MELPGLAAVPASMRDAVRHYARRLLDHTEDRVQSLTLYGPIAGPRFDPRRQTAQSVVVMPTVELAALRRLAEEGHLFGRARIAAPLVLTPDFLRASLDSYPLELIEIQVEHLVVFGDDAFASLVFDPKHVRLQCERELKTLALAMRQTAVTDGANDESIRRATGPSLAGLLRTLRGLLWLKDRRQPLPPEAMLAEVEGVVGQKLQGAWRVLEAPRAIDWSTFQQLYGDVEALGRYADSW